MVIDFGNNDPCVLLMKCLALDGEVWECGTHRGVTAAHLAAVMVRESSYHTLRLFDTFNGRPELGPEDATARSCPTTFEDTSLAQVQKRLGRCDFVQIHAGLIPETFAGLEDARIAFAYVDLDLYASTRDALQFVLPRLVPGGLVLVDDYLAPEVWPGVRAAVDEFVPPERRTVVGHRVVVQ